MTDPIRLSKRLAELTACSRREAELYIEGGWVSVDGEVIEEPQFKVLDQRVELLPGARAETIEPATLLLHKPAGWRHDDFEGLLAAGRRWSDDPSPLRALKKHFARQRPTLALDSEASGLVVFSQQHGVLRKLVDDGARLEQEYLVEVAGDLAAGGLERLRHGLAYQGRRLSPCKVSWQNESHLRFALKDVLPGQLRFMCESEGWKCGASAACASARCRWPGYRSANGATSASTNASERSFEATQGAPRRLPADPPVHGDERAVAGVAQGVGDLGHRAAFGQAPPRFEQARLGSPAGETQAGLLGEQTRQGPPAGADLTSPCLDAPVQCGLRQQRLGHLQRPRIARHRQARGVCRRARQFIEQCAQQRQVRPFQLQVGCPAGHAQDQFAH